MKNKLFKGLILGTQLGTIVVFSQLFYKTKKEHREFKMNYKILTSIEKIEQPECDAKEDFKKIKVEKIRNIIEELYKKLSKDPNVNLSNFKRNLSTLALRNIEEAEELNVYDAEAIYDYFDNEIFCDEDVTVRTLVHELLHMASTYYGENAKSVRFCGFTQEKLGNQIGVGLTEGYTELLSKRYFNEKEYMIGVTDGYIVEMSIVESLEKIVEKDKLTNLYFNADLKGLISELKKYNDLENILKFIRSIDTITTDLMLKKTNLSNRKYNECIKSCVEFLIESYINKLKQQMFNHEIDYKVFETNLYSFVENVNKIKYVFNGKNVSEKFISDKKVLKILANEEKKINKASKNR